jgi:hypothetical protein
MRNLSIALVLAMSAVVVACAEQPIPTEPAGVVFKKEPPPTSFICESQGYPFWFTLTEKELKKLKGVMGDALTDYVRYSLGKTGGTLYIQSYPDQKDKFVWSFRWLSLDTRFAILHVQGETSQSSYSWGTDGSPLNQKQLFDADGEGGLYWGGEPILFAEWCWR